MRGVFVASGPDFRSDGAVVEWIKLVDQYQIFLEFSVATTVSKKFFAKKKVEKKLAKKSQRGLSRWTSKLHYQILREVSVATTVSN